MKKIYDKLFLLIAVLAFAGGGALYFMTTGGSPDGSSVSGTITSENPYEAVPVPRGAEADVSWPSPEPQSSEWVYDVFTPPKIFIDENGQFTAEGWTLPPPASAFGVYLAEISRKPYRIQIQGYIEEDRSDSMKSWLLLFDEERQVTVRVRPGAANKASEFEVLNFEVKREINAEEGRVEVTAKATILDQRTGEQVILVDGERLFESETTVRIRSEEDESFLAELSQVGESFVGPLGSYVLLEINLEASTVTVEKEASAEEEAVTQVLTVESVVPPEEPETSEDVPLNQSPNTLFPF